MTYNSHGGSMMEFLGKAVLLVRGLCGVPITQIARMKTKTQMIPN